MDWEDINSPDDLTVEVIKQYMRIEHDLDDFELQMYLKSALSYARKYVRMEDTDTPLDVDLIMPVLMMVSHFYENKSPINVNNAKLDDIFDGILWMNRGVVL
ncbi:MAG: head-tail connector protein [Erysipelotrichaceae bacterium]|nr:head-tail connector protein [Erysipelotrichaceae bacterium]